MRKELTALLIALAQLVARPGHAWVADSTHAGLTEEAAFAARLHDLLTRFHGRALGLYDRLTVPKSEAAPLYDKLLLVDPTTGGVPDARGGQSALGWLIAGAILEAIPAERSSQHFYDPVHHTGLTGKEVQGLAYLLGAAWRKPDLAADRLPAPEWIHSDKNELGLLRFWRELALSATAKTAGERDQHLAFALVCAGAMLHVLQDMSSPSRVRDDLAAHLETLGAGIRDRGSRFEELGSLAYGRLGLPAGGIALKFPAARDFFSNKAHTGLADVTAKSWYSANTFPRPLSLKKSNPDLLDRLLAAQEFPEPAPVSKRGAVDLQAARSPGGGMLRDDQGVCLAQYRVVDGELVWWIGDECALEQVRVVLPLAERYSAGFLGWLFRGTLTLRANGGVSASLALGSGTLTFLSEDEHGNRTPLGAPVAISKAAARTRLSQIPSAPAGARFLVAVFAGADSAGEPIVAVGRLTLR